MKPLFLDPDYTKEPPKDERPFCIRCQKPLKLGQGFACRYVDEWSIVLDDEGKHLIGSDCYKKILKLSEG